MTYRRLKDVFETELYVGVNELDDARYFLPFRPRGARYVAGCAAVRPDLDLPRRRDL